MSWPFRIWLVGVLTFVVGVVTVVWYLAAGLPLAVGWAGVAVQLSGGVVALLAAHDMGKRSYAGQASHRLSSFIGQMGG